VGWEFAGAPDGNVALVGEPDLDVQCELTMGLAFVNTQHQAITTLFSVARRSFPRASQALYGAMGAR
jgi:Glucodextranase, domain N